MGFQLSDTPIDSAAARARLWAPQSGGYVSFEGWVRDHHEGKGVVELHYSAYAELALGEGQRLLDEALKRFAIDGAACIHRVGVLKPGDLAIWIGVSAGHRGAAFEACRYLIDSIKDTVPIWKHEFYADGSRAWVRNHHCS